MKTTRVGTPQGAANSRMMPVQTSGCPMEPAGPPDRKISGREEDWNQAKFLRLIPPSQGSDEAREGIEPHTEGVTIPRIANGIFTAM